ncbi:hypothetical protein ACH4CE_35455 [Streptomyces gelaticus]|uniref:hypothetical protein n=1 Tax=Streptomyces gelaticus TaxID=285446 RepID=UPI0037B340C9
MPAHWKPVSSGRGELTQFAERLRDAVSHNGFPVREIASWQEISRSTVYAVLAGERLPSQEQLEGILMITFPKRRAAPAAEITWLFDARRRLEKARRKNVKPPAPAVRLGPVAEQERFTTALNDWVSKYRDHFPYWWPDSETSGGGVSRGWLQRFLDGKAIPSEGGLASLLPQDRPYQMPLELWPECVRDHDRLQDLAIEAQRSRRSAREVLRILQGGR